MSLGAERPPRVLYIDDDLALGRLVQRHLGRLGYEVECVTNGTAGADRVASEQFDLVALDHYMPGIDGLATLERIRSLPDAPSVVYVTGSDDSRIAVAALKAGASDYVIKDGSENFFTLLANAIEQARSQVELRRAKDRADEAFRQAKETAELASREKSRLLSAAGHDLRQPLLVIRMVLDQVETAKPERLERLLKLADRAVITLDRAFESLLEAARLESGRVEPRRRTFALDPLLAEVAEEWQSTAAEKGLALRHVRTTLWIESDPDMLRTVLRNFVGNAVKYTDKGGVLIGCRRVGKGIEIQVVDTGIGIEEPALSSVFDEFRQLHPGARGGLGLGLSIVRRTAAMLGHKLSVRSRHDIGSIFGIRVPRAEAPPEA